MIICEGCEKKEAVYSVTIFESESHSNLICVCEDCVGGAVKSIADDGYTATVNKPDATKDGEK